MVVVAVLGFGMGATVWGLKMRRLAREYALKARLNKWDEALYRGQEVAWWRVAREIDERPTWWYRAAAFGSSDDLAGELLTVRDGGPPQKLRNIPRDTGSRRRMLPL